MFFLRGFLICPICDRKLTGSFSQGSKQRYPYYHCHKGCRIRINAVFLNNCYQNKLQEWVLSSNAIELFSNILEDQNIKTLKAGYLHSQNLVERKLKEEGGTLSQARKLFIVGILKLDDYNELKKENEVNTKCLKRELHDITAKLKDIDRKEDPVENRLFAKIFQGFQEFDTADKRYLIDLIPPINIDYKTGNLSLNLNSAFSKILSKNSRNEFH
ncbi:zinc ribbon domain-containing protein [Chryseobacterium sp. SIMBA_029]|uniref:zinc ribbon domain-containing protein n=1 Tax=Chryseobacterium sp. SIMBA_029 TaxID=3085772 RepID=UPI00397E4051